MGHVYALKIMQVMITVETTIGRDYQNSKVRLGAWDSVKGALSNNAVAD